MERSAIPAPAARTLLALLVPLFTALFAAVLFGQPTWGSLAAAGLPLAAAALPALFLGLRWYGATEMGFRGRRPLFASIGFSVLAWFALLLARFVFLPWDSTPDGGAFVQFYYLLVFEAFCVHLWAFGFFFRSVAAWRGPLTAAVTSGLLFGLVALFFFQEGLALLGAREANALLQLNQLLFFAAWGILYGMIRLRSGSFLGMVPVQAFQSLTAWYILQPPPRIPPAALNNFYLAGLILFALITWRLWPRVEEDYRV